MSTPIYFGTHLSEEYVNVSDPRNKLWIIYITYEDTVWGELSE